MTDARPALQAKPENGPPVDDPSEDQLRLLLEDLEHGKGSFFIVERTSGSGGQTYVQALREDDGRYLVEYRAGGHQQHFGTEVADLPAAHRLITGWASERPGWKDGHTWTPVEV